MEHLSFCSNGFFALPLLFGALYFLQIQMELVEKLLFVDQKINSIKIQTVFWVKIDQNFVRYKFRWSMNVMLGIGPLWADQSRRQNAERSKFVWQKEGNYPSIARTWVFVFDMGIDVTWTFQQKSHPLPELRKTNEACTPRPGDLIQRPNYCRSCVSWIQSAFSAAWNTNLLNWAFITTRPGS